MLLCVWDVEELFVRNLEFTINLIWLCKQINVAFEQIRFIVVKGTSGIN